MMHASNAFLNGAAVTPPEKQILLRVLLTSIDLATADPAKRRDDEKARDERKSPTANEKGSNFKNDPDDAANPNEVRERHNQTVKPN